MPTISARLPEEEQAELDDVADLLSEDRSTTIRKALREGLSTLRQRVAAERYQAGDVSAIEAAELADCTVAEWLEIAHRRNLTTQLEPADLELDADVAGDL
jgi:predicted HTH domain antitoxin